MSSDAAIRLERLRQFIRRMLPVAIAFFAVYLFGAIAWRSAALAGAALDVAGFAVSLVVATRWVRRGHLEEAARTVAYALCVMSLIGAALLPWLLAALVFIPVAAVALVIPYLSAPSLRRFLRFTVESSWIIVYISGGRFAPVRRARLGCA